MNKYVEERYKFEDLFDVRLVPQFKKEIDGKIYQSFSCIANAGGNVRGMAYVIKEFNKDTGEYEYASKIKFISQAQWDNSEFD